MVLAFDIPISFERPEWLWLLLAVPIVVGVSMRTLSGLERSRRIGAITLRSLVILVLAMVLAEIHTVRRNRDVAVIFVVDRSRSIPEGKRIATRDYVKEAVAIGRKLHKVGKVGLVGFDGQADVDLIPSEGDEALLNFGLAVQPDRTDVAAGVRMAMAAFPEGYAKRIVILTDGNENVGDFSAEVEAAAANGVAIDVVPLQYEHGNEIMFDRIVAPAHASKDTKIPLRMVVRSQIPTNAKLTVYHNDVEVPLDDNVLQLSGSMRPDPFTIPLELHGGGVHRFDAKLTPTDGNDGIVENNSATAFTFVEARGKVLILSQTTSDDDRVLYEALIRENVEAEWRNVEELSVDLLKLQEYSVVVLCNISADTFNEEQHKALASYVSDFGGGLVMTGGDEGFGAGGWIGTPIEEVSPVSFEVKHRKVMPRGALAIVMHSCEIPRGNYWGEKVAIAAINAISSRDYLGVICYSWTAGGPNWDVPLAPAINKPAVIAKVKKMQIGDMPDFAPTMNIAVKDLMALPDASQRHMIIISDGDPSPPNAATINTMVQNSITCSTVGIGYGSHVMEQPLRKIAADTGGRFYGVKNPNALPQIFVKEAKVIKRPLIHDEPFQPQLVSFAQTVQGIGTTLPPLGGMVMTQKKPDAVMPIARVSSDGNDPVLAHWNYEMGKMAVFTSGWWPRWGTDWAAWEAYGKFWKQIVEWAMRQSGSADFDIITRLEGKKGRVVIEALNKDAGYLNFLNIIGKVTTPDMASRNLYLTQTGPGTYEATFDVNDDGNYLINLRYTGGDNEAGMIRTGLSVPYSPEYRDLDTNFSLLTAAAEQTGGRVLAMDPANDDVFSRDLPPSVSRRPVWQWVVKWLLLPLFILDVAVRRLASVVAMSIYVEVAVFALACAMLYHMKAPPYAYVSALVIAELVGWAIRWRYIVPALQYFTASVTGVARAGQRSTQSLSQLKDVREKVRTDLETKREERRAGPTIELEPTADPKRRFDLGEAAEAEPAEELSDALGGASATDELRTKPEPGKPGAPGGDLAARLRRAKQRARDQMKDQSKDEDN